MLVVDVAHGAAIWPGQKVDHDLDEDFVREHLELSAIGSDSGRDDVGRHSAGSA